MKKVITYGTYDLIHYGHIRLLERAKDLGDYLIVGVTSDAYDRERGKINGNQTVSERIKNVEKLGIADQIIIEEYDGQKIDDIIKYGVDIFTVGSDWNGKFDYLKEYCDVVYLDRTEGVSSSQIRSDKQRVRIGIIGESTLTYKFNNECKFVNGAEISGLCYENELENKDISRQFSFVTSNYDELLDVSDAVYVVSHPSKHYEHVKKALLMKKHVICESPIASTEFEYDELIELAKENSVVLMDSIKTAYSLAYQRLILLLKTGKIGKIVSVDATCTSLKDYDLNNEKLLSSRWGSYSAWGPTALLPIFQLLGTDYINANYNVIYGNEKKSFDIFTNINFIYDSAIASIKVGNGVKSEGELVVSGTKGYAYVPAPWWKSGYFEMRYEDGNDSEKFYYKIEGEGIRYEIVAFLNLINIDKKSYYIDRKVSREFVKSAEKISKFKVNFLSSR